MTASSDLHAASGLIEMALDATGPAEVLIDVDVPELHRRAALIAEMQRDLDELARRTEFDLTKFIRRQGGAS